MRALFSRCGPVVDSLPMAAAFRRAWFFRMVPFGGNLRSPQENVKQTCAAEVIGALVCAQQILRSSQALLEKTVIRFLGGTGGIMVCKSRPTLQPLVAMRDEVPQAESPQLQ